MRRFGAASICMCCLDYGQPQTITILQQALILNEHVYYTWSTERETGIVALEKVQEYSHLFCLINHNAGGAFCCPWCARPPLHAKLSLLSNPLGIWCKHGGCFSSASTSVDAECKGSVYIRLKLSPVLPTDWTLFWSLFSSYHACFQMIEPFTSHYVFALGISRFFACAHWIIQVCHDYIRMKFCN